jgi:2-polyprenyl-3-methyl-5-hydroxy-6-metoxy-1,4-benzoquinol methylase
VSGFDLEGEHHIADGILACSGGHRWPILDEVPRLVGGSQFTTEEREFLSQPTGGQPRRTVTPLVLSDDEVERELACTVRRNYGYGPGMSPGARRRAEREIEYTVAEYRGLNKNKYLTLVRERLRARPRRLLDVGGDLGASAKCFAAAYGCRDVVVVDLNIANHHAFKSADRRLCLVRADAQNLPFADAAFDLVVSAFLLEHVPDWRTAASEMMRVAAECFISFGPNRWFPYEIGHIDAPLAGTLPKSMAKYVAYVWLWLTRQGRSLKRIEESLAEVHFISSRAFRGQCRNCHRQAINLFPQLVREVTCDRQAPHTSVRRLVQWLGWLAPWAASALVAAGVEPQMYYFIPPRDETS